jgi:hypothetical protein
LDTGTLYLPTWTSGFARTSKDNSNLGFFMKRGSVASTAQ